MSEFPLFLHCSELEPIFVPRMCRFIGMRKLTWGIDKTYELIELNPPLEAGSWPTVGTPIISTHLLIASRQDDQLPSKATVFPFEVIARAISDPAILTSDAPVSSGIGSHVVCQIHKTGGPDSF